MSEVTISLIGSYQAHGQTITSVTLREPKGQDFVVCGYPIILLSPDQAAEKDGDQAELAGNGEMRPNAGAINKLIARLGNIPASTVGEFTAGDWNACMGAVLGFLDPAKPAKSLSTPVSASPSPGA